jgi:hypothetical protein
MLAPETYRLDHGGMPWPESWRDGSLETYLPPGSRTIAVHRKVGGLWRIFRDGNDAGSEPPSA